MENIGLIIKKLREEKGLPLRIVAAHLDIDQAILSKIEHGKRRAYREHIVKLAAFFNVQEEELLVAWLSDKIFHEVKDEKCALKAMQVAEEKVKSFAKNNR
jgi:transcriptional regulator with XRE-family HTH domain